MMDTSHDCKSNTKSTIIIMYIKLKKGEKRFYWNIWENKWVFNCDLNEECVCVADGERQIIPGYRTLIGERSLA